MNFPTNALRLLLACVIAAAWMPAQTIELVPVVSRQVHREIKLTGEFLPYETVDLRARVPGFVEKVLVDRGSTVKKDDVLVELAAPEMQAQLAEAESKVQAAI